METLKAAFVFLAPEADPAKDRAWVKTPAVHLVSVAVKNYQEAVETCKALVQEEGITAFELCGGFGNRGAALVTEAVGEGIPVGVIRFDGHPGLGNASGDTVFA